MAQVPHYNPNGYLSVLLVIFDPSTAVALLVAVGAFVLICIFDISGVLFGLSTLGGLQNDETDEIPGSLWAFIASSVGAMLAGSCADQLLSLSVSNAPRVFVRERQDWLGSGRHGGLLYRFSVFGAPLSSRPRSCHSPGLDYVGRCRDDARSSEM